MVWVFYVSVFCCCCFSFFLSFFCLFSPHHPVLDEYIKISFIILKLDEKYETVACGKTPDQLEMTELAKQCAMTFKPRSLVL